MTTERIVAVVEGGPSSEAEVSHRSAEGVAAALARAGHRASRLELDENLPRALRAHAFDVVFPVTHGSFGEDGCLQGLLEILGLPYVGSDVLASALASHKAFARRVLAASGLPVAKGLVIPRSEARGAADRARREIGARLVVKPAASGSAIGVTRLSEDASQEEVAEALRVAWGLDECAIVEHFARGREITCGVLDVAAVGRTPVALPVTEIKSPNDPFYNYEAKYAPGRSVHLCPAPLTDEMTARVQAIALAAHGCLGCRDLSRADFIVGDDDQPEVITLLEVNTIPGFTKTSLYPEEAAAMGYDFASLCSILVENAYARGPTRRNATRPIPV